MDPCAYLLKWSRYAPGRDILIFSESHVLVRNVVSVLHIRQFFADAQHWRNRILLLNLYRKA